MSSYALDNPFYIFYDPSEIVQTPYHPNVTLYNITPLIFQNPRVPSLSLSPRCHIYLPYIIGFDIKRNHQQQKKTTRSHASRCHHHIYRQNCNVDFVPFHDVTCCMDSLLSRIHANAKNLVNTMRALVATCMILGRLECIANVLVLHTMPFDKLLTIRSPSSTLEQLQNS